MPILTRLDVTATQSKRPCLGHVITGGAGRFFLEWYLFYFIKPPQCRGIHGIWNVLISKFQIFTCHQGHGRTGTFNLLNVFKDGLQFCILHRWCRRSVNLLVSRFSLPLAFISTMHPASRCVSCEQMSLAVAQCFREKRRHSNRRRGVMASGRD